MLGLECVGQEPFWATQVVAPDNGAGVDADLDSEGNIFVVGHGKGGFYISYENTDYAMNGQGDAFLAKFSPEHQLIWFKTLGANGDRDEAMDVHVDRDDNVLVLLSAADDYFTFNGDTIAGIDSPGFNGGEGVILKIDNDGNYLWHDDGSVSSSFEHVTTDSSGNVYLTGWFMSFIELDDSLTLVNSSVGTTRDMLLAKYSSSGNILWAKQVGGDQHNDWAFGYNVAYDWESGKVIVLGRYNNEVEFETATLFTTEAYSAFLAAYDVDGNELWVTSLFNGGGAYCKGLDISTNGIIGVSGYNLSFSHDARVAFYDLNGTPVMERIYPATSECKMNSLAFDQTGNCFITGNLTGQLLIGSSPDDTIIEAPANTITWGFMLKLDADQNFSWSRILPARNENKVSYKQNRILYSGQFQLPFVYNYGWDTLPALVLNPIFAEFRDPFCPVTFGGDTTICQGDTLTLNAIGPNSEQLWQDGSTDPVFQVSQEGLYWVESNSECGSFTDSVYVFFAEPPVIELGNDTTLCSDELLILNVSTFGASYLWNDSTNSATLEVWEQGMYYVDVSVNGCNAFDTIVVDYYPIIDTDLGNDTALCLSDSLILDATFSNATYLWQDNSTDSTFLVEESGTYWVDVSVGNCSVRDSIHVIETSLALDIVENGNVLSCPGDFVTYQWYLNNEMIEGAADSIYLASVSGNYFVVAVDSNGCTGASPNLEFTYQLGITENRASVPFIVYPNPNEGMFRLKLIKPQLYLIEVINTLGQSVLSRQYLPGNVALINLPYAGVYHLRLYVEDSMYIQKVVIE